MREIALENNLIFNIGSSNFFVAVVSFISKVGMWNGNNIVLPNNIISNSARKFAVESKSVEALSVNNTATLIGSGIQSITLRRLSNQQFVLKHPIEIKVEPEHKGYIFANGDLDVYIFSEFHKEIKEALDEWEQVLIDSYCFFHTTPDDQLTTGAKILKEQLEAAIEKQ